MHSQGRRKWPRRCPSAGPHRNPHRGPRRRANRGPNRERIRSAMPLRRFLSFRDFDWWLLLLVIVMCGISLVEVHSTTIHTKFARFESVQMLAMAAGVVLMFIVAKIDYHRVLDWAPWAYGFGLLSLVAIF